MRTTEAADVTLLKEYLNQYNKEAKYKHDLENRLKRIEREMEFPLRGIGYSPLPMNNTGSSKGASSYTLRKAEIEDRIQEQIELIANSLINIMSVLDYLPIGSEGRRILEYRYIDDIPWSKVYEKMHLSKTPCFDRVNEAYAELLKYPRVVYILEDYMENKKQKETKGMMAVV